MSIYTSQVYLKDLDVAAKNTICIEKLKGKSVLITGASGTIGSFVVDMIMRYNTTKEANVIVYAAGRDIERLKERFQGITSDELQYVQYDMRSEFSFDCPVDYIIHAAGNAHPMAFNSDPVGTIVGNVTGTYRLLEYGRTHGAERFLYVSSGEVYGQGDAMSDAFEEDYQGYVDISSARSGYPLSKRTTENLCVSYSKQYGLETVIVRPCHTYGPGMTAEDSRANAQFFRNVISGEDIVLKSAGEQLRSYCYVADCASAIMTVLLNGESEKAYNIANPDTRITIAEFAKTVAEAAGKKVVYFEPDAVDIANRTPIKKQVLSSKRLEALGWKGCYSVFQGVANTIEILKNK